jgi:hypothetical protein
MSAFRQPAFSIGRQAYERISSAKSRGAVHSCYRGAINVQTELGLVCLVPRETGRGPLNINLDAQGLARVGDLASGSPVATGVKELAFENGFRILLSNAGVYEPTGRFEGALLPPRAIKRNISVAKDVALLVGHLAGVGELLEATGGSQKAVPPLSAFSAAAFPNTERLLGAIRAGDAAGAEKATRGLVGLGIGLTPSADDMLCGILVSIVLGSINGIGAGGMEGLAARIGDACRGRTSALSCEFLRQAASGRANERVMRLVESIYTGTTGKVRAATLDAIKIGATSGTDTIVGVVLGATAALASKEVAG